MAIKGAGGTPGGTGSFVIGFLMMCLGFYLLLQSIVVNQLFGLGMGLYTFGLFGGAFSVTSGMILIPLLFGVGLIFFNFRSITGWALTLGCLAALIGGVLANIHFSMRTMSLFDLLCILVLLVGGLGLFLRSFRNNRREFSDTSGDAEK